MAQRRIGTLKSLERLIIHIEMLVALRQHEADRILIRPGIECFFEDGNRRLRLAGIRDRLVKELRRLRIVRIKRESFNEKPDRAGIVSVPQSCHTFFLKADSRLRFRLQQSSNY